MQVILSETEQLYREHDQHEWDREAQDAITEELAGEYSQWSDEAFAAVEMPTPETLNAVEVVR